MLDAFLSAGGQVFHPTVLAAMLFALPIGLFVGLLPGIRGEVPNAATVLDGHPLAKQGRAGYAIGAALLASALGGVFGCLILILLLPVMQPVVLAFASPENFFLCLAGI